MLLVYFTERYRKFCGSRFLNNFNLMISLLCYKLTGNLTNFEPLCPWIINTYSKAFEKFFVMFLC